MTTSNAGSGSNYWVDVMFRPAPNTDQVASDKEEADRILALNGAATNDADTRNCTENQIGVNSPAYDPAPYSPVHEAGVTQFVHWYCTHLEGRLREDGR